MSMFRDMLKRWQISVRMIKQYNVLEANCNKIYRKNLLGKVMNIDDTI